MDYIIVAVKDENYLKQVINELKEYIVEKADDSEFDLQHNLKNFKTYFGIKKGYTKILTKYWRDGKLHIEIISTLINKIDDYTERELVEKGLNKCGFIIIKSYL